MSLETLSFPGVTDPCGLQAVRTLGVFPDRSVLWMNPQATNVSGYGNLVFGIAGTNITFVNCQVDSVTYRASIGGHQVGLVLLDRRWVWRYARISGAYNIVGDDGVLVNAKNPRELAALLLDAMGETGYDVSVLPTDGNPQSIWDYAEAPMELARLCSFYGCDVSLKLDDFVDIVLLGAGAAPVFTSNETSLAMTADPKQLPVNLRFLAGDTVIECKIKLEPVGADVDGLHKPIDDLSYKPAGGWATAADLTEFTGINDPSERALATREVWRRYRVSTFVDDSLDVPGLGTTLDSIQQILPLKDYRLTSLTGDFRPARPTVGGFFWQEGNPSLGANVTDFTEIEQPFTIDYANGEVYFSRPVVQESSGQWVAADLYLTIAFTVTDSNLVREREERTLSMGGPFGEFIVREDTVYRRLIVSYDPTYPLVEYSTDDNQTDVDDTGDTILADVALQFASTTTGGITYNTIVNVDSSGLVRQVQWSISTTTGFSTAVSLACDGLPYIRRLSERELWRSSRQAVSQTELRALKHLLASKGIT